jgi:hypothetical protein
MEDVFVNIFQARFVDECFHSLQTFSVSGRAFSHLTDCVCHLTCCRWVMESKCLRRIALSDCCVDGPAVIAQFLQFDVCLREIILDGAALSQPLPPLKQVAVREFSSFWLSNPVKASILFFKSLLLPIVCTKKVTDGHIEFALNPLKS